MRVLKASLFLALSACSGSPSRLANPGPLPTTAPDLAAPTGEGAGGVDLAAAAGPDLSAGASDLSGADLAPDPGPWPVADVTYYGGGQALGGPILDATPDEAQNIWAITSEKLYLLKPGQSSFRAYGNADGLHVVGFTGPEGESLETSLTAVAGGGPNEVFLGYYGFESDHPYTDTDQQKQLGNADHLTLKPDGTLSVPRLLFRCDFEGLTGCWEDRSVRRMIYVHDGVARGHVFLGMNHGVVHTFQDHFGDHVHVEVWYHPATGQPIEKMGEWYGLAITPSGGLWIGGGHAVGEQSWDPDPHAWVSDPFIWAFTLFTDDHGLDTAVGYREDHRGTAVTSDGVVWMATKNNGLWSWDPRTNRYSTVRGWPQAPANLMDIQADPDDTLWLVDFGGNLWRFDPTTGNLAVFPGVSDVRRINIDRTVTPRALYVSMGSGLAVIRAK